MNCNRHMTIPTFSIVMVTCNRNCVCKIIPPVTATLQTRFHLSRVRVYCLGWCSRPSVSLYQCVRVSSWYCSGGGVAAGGCGSENSSGLQLQSQPAVFCFECVCVCVYCLTHLDPPAGRSLLSVTHTSGSSVLTVEALMTHSCITHDTKVGCRLLFCSGRRLRCLFLCVSFLTGMMTRVTAWPSCAVVRLTRRNHADSLFL